jgi:undecaprenyl-diphosphatase
VAFSLVATAAILGAAEMVAGTIGRRSLPAKPLREALLWRDAVGMGLAQALALFPGVSRSGSTMAGGLALGLGRDAAARFSFLLAIPAIAGANALELPQLVRAGVGAPEVTGFLAAMVSGYASVAVLLRYLRTHSFLPFAGYCLVAGPVAGVLLG